MGSDNGDKSKASPSGLIPVVIMLIVPPLIGLGIAKAIYSFGDTEKYSANISGVVANDQHWTMLAIFVLGRTITLINALPMIWKFKVMTKDAGNLRSNMFIYETKGGEGRQVCFVDDGDVGKYNRANRSLQHMGETYGVLLAGLYAASQVFPFPVFVLTCFFGLGRALHQLGYTVKYGSHGPGFMIATLSVSTLEGMCALVCLKAFLS